MIDLVLVLFILAMAVAVGASFFVKRHGEATAPRADWRRTDEVFRDPGTNRMMRVWIDGVGERHYVPERSA
jgi:hypothetical protein